jgi:heptose-I-phosphate ethanolaminephosphotransferase
VLQAIFNTNPAESSEFFRHNGRDVAGHWACCWWPGGLWLAERRPAP